MVKSRESAEQLATLVTEIRRDIIFGMYPPGTWLKAADLQKQYNVSVFLVRRALGELSKEKIINHSANAGFHVAQPDASTRFETRLVRIFLERSAAPIIAARAMHQNIVQLRELATIFETCIGEDGRRAQAAANHEFHTYLYSITGNSVLTELITDLRSRSSHHATTGRWQTVEGLKASSEDHFQIVDAIEARDPNRLETVIVRHIEAF